MGSQKKWSLKNIPSQEGKIAVVTGANAGLGFETSKALAKKGIHVVMACRNLGKAEESRIEILKAHPEARIEKMALDLADLESVKSFAQAMDSKPQIDLLINNAGVMMTPYRTTKQGHELQWGVNFLGHFLLTSLLWNKLTLSGEGRVIHVSSLAHRYGKGNFDQAKNASGYSRIKAYAESKLANLVFALELQRRAELKGVKVKSIAAHPGVSDTELGRYLPSWAQIISPVYKAFFAQNARNGAMPQIRAALDSSLNGGEYIGPGGFREYKGEPVKVETSTLARSNRVAQKLWEIAERETKMEFSL